MLWPKVIPLEEIAALKNGLAIGRCWSGLVNASTKNSATTARSSIQTKAMAINNPMSPFLPFSFVELHPTFPSEAIPNIVL